MNWIAPPRTPMVGRYCRLEPFSVEAHAPDLHRAFAEDTENDLWKFRDQGPFDDEDAFRAFAEATMTGDDPLFFAILDARTGEALGAEALMRIVPVHGVVEVGTITFSPRLKRTRIATEAIYLLARRVFDELGYRRFEWKCDDGNAASKRAALRYGFVPEGLFRQHMMVAGKNRDTAWFSMLDSEWPQRKAAFETWLDPANFNDAGQQRVSLSALNERKGAS